MSKAMSSKKKSEQLGIPFGTANNRLRKSILFQLLKKYGDNVCFHCHEEIKDISQLSIEHKKPWLDADPSLFWDIDNIGFSHLSCNVSASRVNIWNKREAPEGMCWCSKHQAFLPIDLFYHRKDRKKPYHAYCKDCFNEQRNKSR